MANTWTKGRNGDWLVKGAPGQGGTVTVSKRDGTTSTAIIARQIWVKDSVALYAVASSQSQRSHGRRGHGGGGCHTDGNCSSMCSPRSCPCGVGSWFSCC